MGLMNTNDDGCMIRKPWNLPFLAEAREVQGLRRVLRLHLTLWGLPDAVQAAQICVSELTANVIRHVGEGTPTTLSVSMNGTHVRIEIRDPDTRALPTLLDAGPAAESGRGLALVDAIADRWGVVLHADAKVVWCELATRLPSSTTHTDSSHVTRGEALLSLYGASRQPHSTRNSPLAVSVAHEAAIGLIADLLHWLTAHGCDPEEALDHAQMRFESGAGEVA